MLQGKLKAALRVIFKDTKRGILSLESLIPTGKDPNSEITWQTTLDILREKHPKGKMALAETLLPVSESNAAELYHDPIVFEQITGEAIRQAALRTLAHQVLILMPAIGSVHPSRLHPITSAMLWQQLPNVCVPPIFILTALVACRLIPLNKNPGVRPIGIGEVPRRIMAKVILKTIGDDIQSAAGPLQACAEADCEAAIHAMKEIYSRDDTEAILLVEATNAFNVINRQAALLSIRVLCMAVASGPAGPVLARPVFGR